MTSNIKELSGRVQLLQNKFSNFSIKGDGVLSFSGNLFTGIAANAAPSKKPVTDLVDYFLAEYVDIAFTGTYNWGAPSTLGKKPEDTHSRITRLQLAAFGAGGSLSVDVVCDGTSVTFGGISPIVPTGLEAPMIFLADVDQFVAANVTFNFEVTGAVDSIDMVLYGIWEE